LVPPFDRRFEHFRIHVNLSGDVFESISFFDPALGDFRNIVVAPAGVVAFVVDDRNSDRPELPALFV
jgi:hypothetical protein